MTFLLPWLVAAGLALALVPVALHLIARRPPSRAPLPTARFLRPESRSRVHLDRRPTDLLLMALRACFLVVLVSALAEPSWRGSGTTDLVLADATADPAALADSLARFADARILRFDTVADADAPSPAWPDYGTALRAAVTLAPRLGADSVRLWLVTTPRWAGWAPGTTAARRAWPGPIGLVPIPAPPARVTPAAPRTAAVRGPDGAPISRALRAAGIAQADSVAAVVFVPGTTEPGALLAGGGTVVRIADDGPPGLPPVHAGPLALDVPGTTPPDRSGRVLAFWHDGSPAVVADRREGGCLVRSGIDLRSGAVQAAPDFPAFLARLAAGCDAPPDALADVPLDAGARALLTGAAPPGAIAVPAGGVPLRRWFLLLALVLAITETALVARRGTSHAPAGTSAA